MEYVMQMKRPARILEVTNAFVSWSGSLLMRRCRGLTLSEESMAAIGVSNPHGQFPFAPQLGSIH